MLDTVTSFLRPTLREQIVREARSWLGTPFVHGAAIKMVGVDCVQFGRSVGIATGVLPHEFPDFLPYPTGWLLERGDTRYRDALVPYMDCLWDRAGGAPLVPLMAGDMLLFRVGRAAAHSAIVTTWPMVVHAQDALGFDGCVCEASAIANALAARPLVSAWRARALR